MVKSFDRRLLNIKDIPPESAQFLAVVNSICWVALIMHSLFLLMFSVLKIYPLALVNVGSVGLYLLSIYLNRKGNQNISQLLGGFEVLVHSTAAILLLGWSSGYHYYMICLIPMVFFFPTFPTFQSKIGATMGLFIHYGGLYLLSDRLPPVFNLHQHELNTLNFMNIIGMFILFGFLSYYYVKSTHKVEDELRHVNEQLRYLATTDPLTHLMNRRTILEQLEREANQMQRGGSPFALILCDVDDFKSFNDHYGHECGDYVLESIARLLCEMLRSQDLIARWGGEEFLIVMPGTSLADAETMADLIREQLCFRNFYYQQLQVCITMTFGVNAYTPDTPIGECIRQADHAMLQGKEQGKNCVVTVEEYINQ